MDISKDQESTFPQSMSASIDQNEQETPVRNLKLATIKTGPCFENNPESISSSTTSPLKFNAEALNEWLLVYSDSNDSSVASALDCGLSSNDGSSIEDNDDESSLSPQKSQTNVKMPVDVIDKTNESLLFAKDTLQDLDVESLENDIEIQSSIEKISSISNHEAHDTFGVSDDDEVLVLSNEKNKSALDTSLILLASSPSSSSHSFVENLFDAKCVNRHCYSNLTNSQQPNRDKLFTKPPVSLSPSLKFLNSHRNFDGDYSASISNNEDFELPESFTLEASEYSNNDEENETSNQNHSIEESNSELNSMTLGLSLLKDIDDQESLSLSSVISQSSNLSQLREQYLQANRQSQQSQLRHRLSLWYNTRINHDDDNDEDFNAESSSSHHQQYDQISMMDRSRPIRAYFHQPNTVLNGKLNLILVLSITAVVGLGIGHFIGWSKNVEHKQLSLAQVLKLKQLQDDLLVCMNNQQLNSILGDQENTVDGSNTNQIHKVCINDAAYWTERFRSLFAENHGLIELFQKTQKHMAENRVGSILRDDECVNKTTSDEFHNLKLDLLIKQMEHLKLLEVLEQVKTKEKESKIRVKVLEEENQDLKKKLEEEEQDDQEIVESWGSRVALLQEENNVLRKTIEVDDVEDERLIGEMKNEINHLYAENSELWQFFEQLEKQILQDVTSLKSDQSEDQHQSNHKTVVNKRLDSKIRLLSLEKRFILLRQRINQMMAENEELQSKVALYRWTVKANQEGQQNGKTSSFDANSKEFEQQKNLEQMKVKLNIIHRQLIQTLNENKRWRSKVEQLETKLTKRKPSKSNKADHEHSKSKKSKNEKNEAEEEKSSSKKERRQQSKYDDSSSKDHQQQAPKNKFREWKDSIKSKSKQVWSSIMENMKSNYEKLEDTIFSSKKESEETIIKYGKEFLWNTVERVNNIGDHLVRNGLKNKFVVDYLSDSLNKVSDLLGNSFESTITELRSVFSPPTNKNSPNPSNVKPKTKQQQQEKSFLSSPSTSFSDEKFSDRSSLFTESPLNNNNKKLPSIRNPDWMMKRARARREAREFGFDDDLDDKSFFQNAWILKRGKAREESRVFTSASSSSSSSNFQEQTNSNQYPDFHDTDHQSQKYEKKI